MIRYGRVAFFALLLMAPIGALGQDKQKVIKYRSHTDLDFSEQTVQGKIRSPDVFYIFQRKRSEGPKMVIPPRELNSLRTETRKTLEDML